MLRFLFLISLLLVTACASAQVNVSEANVYLDYKKNQLGEPYFSIFDNRIKQKISEGILPVFKARNKDLVALCPTCDWYSSKPTVAVLLAREGKNEYVITADYVYALIKAGFNIRFISYDDMERQIKDVDAYFLPGGAFASKADWFLTKSRETFAKPGKRFRAYEFIINKAMKENKPLLGICAGMQMMSAIISNQQVKLYPDLDLITTIEHHANDRFVKAHPIIIEKNSKLHSFLKTQKTDVNSRHHVGVFKYSAEILPDIKVVATAPDGITEAIEFEKYPNFLAVQFHPEVFAFKDDEKMQSIFNGFRDMIK